MSNSTYCEDQYEQPKWMRTMDKLIKQNKNLKKRISVIDKEHNEPTNKDWKERYYIRFGDIPENEESKIYCGEQEIGVEKGVSVYPAYKENEDWVIGLTLPITKTSLHTQQHLLEYDNRPCYLVTGDYVGKGSDNEPLIKNVKIVSEIKYFRRKG